MASTSPAFGVQNGPFRRTRYEWVQGVTVNARPVWVNRTDNLAAIGNCTTPAEFGCFGGVPERQSYRSGCAERGGATAFRPPGGLVQAEPTAKLLLEQMLLRVHALIRSGALGNDRQERRGRGVEGQAGDRDSNTHTFQTAVVV